MIDMEGMKGGGRVGVGEDDMGDGMQCSEHPYRNNPGGICAICLQEKLAKLVSFSFPPPPSSSPSFRSDIAASSTTARPSVAAPASASGSACASSSSSSSLTLSARPTSTQKNASESNDVHYHEYYTRRARLPFLLAKKKKKKASANSSSSLGAADIILKRSKSTATPTLVDTDEDAGIHDSSPRKRNGFWSFLYHSSKSSASTNRFKSKSFRDSLTNGTPKISTKNKCSSLGRKSDVVVEETSSPNSHATPSASSFERKVSRSRSVGCGSRSFSGDFFERISNGFGDCTLRRVESQREGKPKAAAAGPAIKERVRCAGIFSGFMVTSSSSSSSSSSSYWVSSSADHAMNGKSTAVALSHGRARSWGWAFASPIRAFSNKPSSKDNRRDIIRDVNDKNATPNLSSIPSLLAVRS